MGKLIIGDNMKRKKKYTKNSFPKKTNIIIFSFFIFNYDVHFGYK